MSPQKLFLKVFVLIFFISTYVVHSQSISAPQLMFDNACSSANHTDFEMKVHISSGFGSNPGFKVKLSDLDGNFDNGVILADSDVQISQLGAYLNITFKLPENTHGENYRVKVVSSSPMIEGEPSDSFGAYKIIDSNLVLLINGQPMMGTTSFVCASGELSLALSNSEEDLNACAINWYKNDELMTQTSTAFTTFDPGEYYAELNYGICSENNTNIPRTIKVQLQISPQLNAVIEANSEDVVEVCEGSDLVLNATEQDPGYIYRWYKDGELISEGHELYSLTVPNGQEQEGVYYFEAKSSLCESVSQEVTVVYGELEVDFVSIQSDYFVLLENETEHLTVIANTTDATFQWYKDGEILDGETDSTLTVSELGVYKVEVTSAQNCNESIMSEEKTAIGAEGIEVQIGEDLAEEENSSNPCENNELRMAVTEAKFILTNGEREIIASDEIYNIDLEWFKDNQSIDSSVNEFVVDSEDENGNYRVNASYKGFETLSNSYAAIVLPTFEIIASHDKLCEGSEVNLSTYQNDNLTYTWYKDNSPIENSNSFSITASEEGTYYVAVDYNGCTIESDSIEIETFDASSITISPSTNIVINRGEFQDIIVEGAEFYEWYNEAGTLLSSSPIYSVNEAGVFTVKAISNECEVINEITVEINDAEKEEIPNVVTPNNDGYNDKWILPSMYTNDETNVEILDTRGKRIFSTVNYKNNWPTQGDLNAAKNSRNTPVFYYIIKSNNSIKAKGTITIIR
ncbi:gliding motility-associated C-terminal domain-containing protein [Aureivirga sp. CE67]|uniref:Ig-like domain-containing protein n=1 Tax=Aureivirga sp. CE67 TaxID=1788983 RepID=UPI0018CAE38C|nr:gliding motility-associated C-terminal domain-containing protein [Aureivirga sp. CE67]